MGEVLAESDGVPGRFLTGFENHQGDARLGTGGPAARPPRAGTATATGAPRVPCRAGSMGSYLHGPVLVRNAGLADHLLQLVVGPLAPFEDEPVERLLPGAPGATLGGPRRRRRRLPR